MSQPPDLPPSSSGSEVPQTLPLTDIAPGSVLQLRNLYLQAGNTVQRTEPATDAAAVLVGRYHLFGCLGQGGMGEVLRGRDPILGRDLAIKVLRSDVVENAAAMQRFCQEAQIAAQLQHPGIAPVYELGQFADGRPFFTMKLVKGQTLSSLLRERSDPTQERHRFLTVFEQICQTMAYAHARGVLHRDLKPHNVMVGAFGEVQVMDWGLAKVLNQDGATLRSQETLSPQQQTKSVIRVHRTDADGETCEGDVLGTPSYMPPEQALGEIDRLDERCDVFSLGAILCEILTGRPPYCGADTHVVLWQARRGELTDALRRLDDCGADTQLITLTKCCLGTEPEKRPRDAGEVAQAVVAYLTSVEERARQAELQRTAAQAREEETRRTAAAERRARRVTLALVLSGLVLVLGGAGSAWLIQQQEAWLEQRRQLERMYRLNQELMTSSPNASGIAKAQELSRLAWVALSRKQYHTASLHFAEALKQDVSLAGNWRTDLRYFAAIAALLAATGSGTDETKLNDAERATLRNLALAWLQADLNSYGHLMENAPAIPTTVVHQRLTHWLEDSNLTAVRDEIALATLPEAERACWAKFWADVGALLERTNSKK